MDLNHFINTLDLAVDWLGVREVCRTTTVLAARDGRYESYNHTMDQGWMIEVLSDGQFASVATNTADLKTLQTAAQKAKNLADQASRHRLFAFTPSVRPPSQGAYHSPYSLPSLHLKDLSDLLIQTTVNLKVDDCIVSTQATAELSTYQTRLVSTHGADVNQTVRQIGFYLGATAQAAGEVQTRTNGGLYTQNSENLFDPYSLKVQANQIGHEAVQLVKAPSCPTGNFDVILTPDQLYLQVHETIGHPLELDRILGDERNYAGWSFVKPEDFGRLQYGPALLNVTFDPTLPSELASYGFDDLGNPARRDYLIRHGLLVAGLGSLESQQRLGVPGVASARMSSWNRPPIDRMANLNIEPGTTCVKDMISQIDDGILMMTNRSWSIDDYRRKFQFGCEYGQRIKKGRLTEIVKNPNYRGITLPFWHKLRAVGDVDSYKVWGSACCGKGEPNQMVGVGHAVPTCWFENVDVFGGG